MNEKESINKTHKGVQRYFLLQLGGDVRTGRPLPTHPNWGSLLLPPPWLLLWHHPIEMAVAPHPLLSEVLNPEPL